jgi:hypothetical protein
LAIGGNWGGVMGVDTQIFPSTYEVDYVRVYQKNTALSEVKEEKSFDANFNKVSNLLRVSFKEQGVYHLFITDMQGRC